MLTAVCRKFAFCFSCVLETLVELSYAQQPRLVVTSADRSVTCDRQDTSYTLQTFNLDAKEEILIVLFLISSAPLALAVRSLCCNVVCTVLCSGCRIAVLWLCFVSCGSSSARLRVAFVVLWLKVVHCSIRLSDAQVHIRVCGTRALCWCSERLSLSELCVFLELGVAGCVVSKLAVSRGWLASKVGL